MTAAELKENFLVLYDKVTNFAAPGYEDYEINIFLNKAQEQLIKRYYNYKGNKYKEGFEETEKRRKDLSELTRNADLSATSISSSQSGISPNGVLYDLPSELLYTLREEVTIKSNDSCLNGNRISVKPITHDEYTINKKNPFKRPDSTLVWRLDYGRDNQTTNQRRHELITDGSFNITTYHLRYLKRPLDIDVNGTTSELDESVHREIIDIAVRIAAGITDPASYQIKVNEEQTTE